MPRNDEGELRLSWSRRLSLRQRILAVNIFAVAILAGSIFYLDGFRTRLTQDEIEQSRSEAVMAAHAYAAAPPERRRALLTQLGRDSGVRLRIYRADGSFDTGTLDKGKLKSETFKEAGTYPYFCEIHPTMHGSVVCRSSSGSRHLLFNHRAVFRWPGSEDPRR